MIALTVSFVTANFKPTDTVGLGSGVYHLRLANDDASRQQGLSGVEKLQVNGGLLMDFQKDGNWGIWMKDMKIPLDIIWLDKNKKVVHIETNAKPEWGTDKVMQPKSMSRYVIELPAGSVQKAGIKIGQEASFNVSEATE